MELDELELVISANTAQITQALTGVQNQLKSTGTAASNSNLSFAKLTSSFALGNIASNILSGTFNKLKSIITDTTTQIVTSGSAYARMIVQTDTVAANMGMTAAQVDNLRNSLAEANTYGSAAESVIKTLAMSGLVDMASSLEAVDARTGETATGVDALVLTMKDLAAVSGVDSAEGIKQVTEFINRGNAEAVDGMIAIGNLGKEYDDFAKTLGKTRAGLSAQEEAQARMNLVMREGQKALGAYANTYTTSAKMASSISDSWTASLELLGSSLEPIWAAATSGLLTFVNDIRAFLIDNSATIQQWAIKVGGYVVAFIRVLGTALSQIPMIGSYFQNMANFELSVGSAVSSTTDKMNKQTEASEALKGSLAGFDEMNVITSSGSSSTGSTLGTSGGSSADVASIGDISGAINTAASAIADSWQPKIDTFFKTISDNKGLIEGLAIAIGLVTIALSVGSIAMGVYNSILGLQKIVVLATAIAHGIASVAVGVWNVICAIATGVTMALGAAFTFLTSPIGLVVIAIALVIGIIVLLVTHWQEVKEKATDVWNGIVSIWGVASTWFNNNVVTPLVNVFTGLWGGLKQGATDAWNGIKNVFSVVTTWFGDTFAEAWTAVKNVFSAGGEIFQGITEGISAVFRTVVNGIIGGINTVISVPFNAINNMLSKLRELSIAGFQPFTWLPTLSVPQIPKLAQGGVITRPSYVLAGEAGSEAIVPLKNNTEWIDMIADKLNSKSSQPLTIKIGEKTFYSGIIDYINDESFRTNAKILNI